VIIVREAEERDVEPAVGVLRVANIEFRPLLPPAFFRAYLSNVLDVRSRLGKARLFVAEQSEGGFVVGAITLYPDASTEPWGWPAGWAGIRAVAVHPDARRLGIGRRLTETCIERAGALGAPTICLHTAPFMQAAIEMYERLGFRRAPEFDRDAREMVDSAVTTEPKIPALAFRLDPRPTHCAEERRREEAGKTLGRFPVLSATPVRDRRNQT
jgi:ribosomal protein S18 acetylase RimI-like enzyme